MAKKDINQETIKELMAELKQLKKNEGLSERQACQKLGLTYSKYGYHKRKYLLSKGKTTTRRKKNLPVPAAAGLPANIPTELLEQQNGVIQMPAYNNRQKAAKAQILQGMGAIFHGLGELMEN